MNRAHWLTCDIEEYNSNSFYQYISIFLFCTTAPPPLPVGRVPLIHEISRSHTTTYHSRYDSSGRVIGTSQRPLSDNTQHSQQTYIYASAVIRTHNLAMRATADSRLRPHGYRDKSINIYYMFIFTEQVSTVLFFFYIYFLTLFSNLSLNFYKYIFFFPFSRNIRDECINKETARAAPGLKDISTQQIRISHRCTLLHSNSEPRPVTFT